MKAEKRHTGQCLLKAWVLQAAVRAAQGPGEQISQSTYAQSYTTVGLTVLLALRSANLWPRVLQYLNPALIQTKHKIHNKDGSYEKTDRVVLELTL